MVIYVVLKGGAKLIDFYQQPDRSGPSEALPWPCPDQVHEFQFQYRSGPFIKKARQIWGKDDAFFVFPLPVVGTEGFWAVILSKHHQKPLFNP